MVLDIGGGTTDVGVVSLGGLVNARNIRIAGDKFNQDIMGHIRNEFKVLVGDKTAEEIKIAASSIARSDKPAASRASFRRFPIMVLLLRDLN